MSHSTSTSGQTATDSEDQPDLDVFGALAVCCLHHARIDTDFAQAFLLPLPRKSIIKPLHRGNIALDVHEISRSFEQVLDYLRARNETYLVNFVLAMLTQHVVAETCGFTAFFARTIS